MDIACVIVHVMADKTETITKLEEMLDRGITEMSRDGEVLKLESAAAIRRRIRELRHEVTGKKRRPTLLRCRL